MLAELVVPGSVFAIIVSDAVTGSDFGIELSFEPPHCLEGTPGMDLADGLDVAPTDYRILNKRRYDAFLGTDLETLLRSLRVDSLLVTGVCTDICVMDFVLTFLSARNHDLMPSLKDILVYEAGCSTYDLPKATAEQLGLPATAAHPQDVTHYMGLYFMASRGARLVDKVTVGA